MARLMRFALAGVPQVVIQRGRKGQPVFVDEADYADFLHALREAARAHQVAVHAYAMLPDRVALLLTPSTDDGVSRMMQSIGRRFVRHINQRHGRSGTPWEGRYRAAMVEAERYVVPCCLMIDRQPVRAGAADAPELYRWSSGAHHVGLVSDPSITDHALLWALGNTPYERQSAYRRRLDESVPDDVERAVLQAVNRGRALGSGEFLDALGAHRLPAQIARPRGRPRRT
jgi:putative transposase